MLAGPACSDGGEMDDVRGRGHAWKKSYEKAETAQAQIWFQSATWVEEVHVPEIRPHLLLQYGHQRDNVEKTEGQEIDIDGKEEKVLQR